MSLGLGLKTPVHEWKMDSTVEPMFLEPFKSLDDDMQVQCLPVYRAKEHRWMYTKVPKVTSLRDFSRIPVWRRRPQQLVYHCVLRTSPRELLSQPYLKRRNVCC